MADNFNLRAARTAKNDEFYTQYCDIASEIPYYTKHLDGKWVYCPCDDYKISNFVKYLKDNFDELKLKHLTSTNYDIGDGAYRFDYDGVTEQVTELKEDGDFRSDECLEIFKQADVIITNPPFSLFREYMAQLIEYKKTFLIIGNGNAICFKEIFPLIKNNIIWIGHKPLSSGMKFLAGPNYDSSKCKNPQYDENGNIIISVMNCGWFTNMEHDKCHEPIKLSKKYSPEAYPKYENYDAIECGRLSNIPIDYDGIIGVPITLFDKYCPEQFEIIGQSHSKAGQELGIKPYDKKWKAINKDLRKGDVYYIKDGKPVIPYFRVMIRHKR